MIDLDQRRKERGERDRTILLGGQEFLIRASVQPETMIAWEEMEVDTPPLEMLAIMDDLVGKLVEPSTPGDDPVARWAELRAREEDAISLEDIFSVIREATSITSGRPTVAPSLSSPGRESTKPSSTDGSPVAVAI